MSEASNTYITLSNGELRQVPAGADPYAVRRLEEFKLQARLNPPKKRRRSYARNKASKRNHRAGTVPSGYFQQETSRHQATADLVNRANEEPDVILIGRPW
ncbi:MAG: hypothetical protein ACREIQ_06180 [Nitrospiria bacterium]